jgi:hypothetical protein
MTQEHYMADKRMFRLRAAAKWLFFLIVMLCAMPIIFAQDGQNADYIQVTPNSTDTNKAIYSYLVAENGDVRFIQHLSWAVGRYVRRYEVIIEREGEQGFVEALRRTTTDTFIEFSFESGRYRYKVLVYDLLNRPVGNPAWKYFSIQTALQPKIASFSPAELARGKKKPYQITVTGQNFSPKAQVVLREQKSGNVIAPVSAQVSGSLQTLLLEFDEKQLVAGSYDVYIKNPGALEASAGTVRILRGLLNGDIIVSVGYAPLVPLLGNVFELFEAPIELYGAYARVGFIPLKTSLGNIGVEFSPFWNYLETTQDDFKSMAHVAGVHVDVLFQKTLPIESMFVNVRLGGGLTSILDFHFVYPNGNSSSLNGFYGSVGAELSFQWIFFRPLFIEAGVAYNQILTVNEETHQGYIRPMVGIGAQF